jgi:perosamine synthetase
VLEKYQELEIRWAEWNDLDPSGMVACSCGTAALHLAFEAIRFRPGSYVLIPDFTMVACARAAALAGLQPRFVDCNDKLLIDPECILPAISKSPEVPVAIMPVHIYGRQCNMDKVVSEAKYHNIVVIEDLSEAHGVRPHKDSNAACWSFYKNKIIGGEEGGAVWFKDREHADRARLLRSLGFTKEHDFTHIPRGCNYRLSNTHAELILQSLDNYESNILQRLKMVDLYNKHILTAYKMPWRHAPWCYDLRIPNCNNLDMVVERLRPYGARHGFKPMSMQAEFWIGSTVGPRALKASQEVLYLPVFPLIEEKQIKKIIHEL